MTRWRLIDTGPLDGPTNMAVDEALLACFDPERSAPLLRLYGWSPSALSLGRFQNDHEVLDLGRCARASVPVVRRITGGGVIYHAEELTYALVCAPHHIPTATTIKESFRILTAFLLCFYEKLGLAARYAVDHCPAGTRFGERTPFCFAGKESYDILVGGRKIGGNAQRRLRHAIFQHGSIPLVNRAAEGAGFLREPPVGIGEATSALAEVGICPDPGELKTLLAEAFRETFGIDWKADWLSSMEEATVSRLLTVRQEKDLP
jgi:lipoate-protein ligase A